MKRCEWSNLENHPEYIKYHDSEWGVASFDDRYLFEMFVLESFHCGLSWLIILEKRDAFKKAFDDFDPNIIENYDDVKITELLNNKGIVRNKLKILATINNAKRFKEVQKEFGNFSNYIWSFTDNEVIYGDGVNYQTTNKLSDTVAKDLKKRGFKFMGTVTAYSYLEAIGVMSNHLEYCFKFNKK